MKEEEVSPAQAIKQKLPILGKDNSGVCV